MGSELVYNEHAIQRMALRAVTEAEVEEVLRSYNVALPGRFDCKNYYKVIGARRISVTVAADNVTIVTVTTEELK